MFFMILRIMTKQNNCYLSLSESPLTDHANPTPDAMVVTATSPPEPSHVALGISSGRSDSNEETDDDRDEKHVHPICFPRFQFRSGVTYPEKKTKGFFR